MIRALARVPGLRRFARAEDGTSTIEFCLWVPFMVFFMAVVVESSMHMLRWMLLDRALDIAVRELRIRTYSPPSHGEFRQLVCDNAFLPDCMNSLQVEFVVLPSATWTAFAGNPDCVDRAIGIDPAGDAPNVGGQPNEKVAVRACALMQPIFVDVGFNIAMPRDSNDELQVIALSAFAQEP